MALPQQPYGLDSARDYPFVPSTEEHSRLNEQANAINELMFGEFSHAPLESPTKILDVGCGTGIQTKLLAKRYPDAMVIGVDPNPVPVDPEKPDNVVYILGKLEDLDGTHELLQPGTFDLVYQRYLVMVVSNWPMHIETMRSLLKPGGWFESQEGSFYDVYDANERLISSDWRFCSAGLRDGYERGIDFRIGNELPRILPQSGFQDVSSQNFPMSFRSGWLKKPQTEKLGRYLEWALPPMMYMLMRRSVKAGENVEALLAEFDEKMKDGPIGTHCRYYVTVGRKMQ